MTLVQRASRPTRRFTFLERVAARFAREGTARKPVSVLVDSFPLSEDWHSSMPPIEALRAAIERRHIHLHYQPIIDLETGSVVSVEALVRWTDPALGSVPAESIVRLAEDSGLIVELGEYVLCAAIEQMQTWDWLTGRTDLRLAVNVSPVQIHQGDLVDMLDRAIEASGFDPRRLDLELTERAAVRGVSALPVFHAIKDRQVTLTLDDFGSGYSSLSRLAQLPIDAMKIDRSLLERVGEPHGEVIVRAVIAMARTLGVRIIAEGVETSEQLAFLTRERCTSVQGYLLSRPVPGDQLVEMLVRGASHRTAPEPADPASGVSGLLLAERRGNGRSAL